MVSFYGQGFCCEPANDFNGAIHTAQCCERRSRWIILRDGFCDDPAQPWTVWRWAFTIDDYAAWAVAPSYEDALTKTTAFMRKYTDVQETHR